MKVEDIDRLLAGLDEVWTDPVDRANQAIVNQAEKVLGAGHAVAENGRKGLVVGVTALTLTAGAASEIGVPFAAASPPPADAPAPPKVPPSTTEITIKRGYTDWWLAEKGSQVSGKSVDTELHEIEVRNLGDNPNDLKVGSQETVPVEVAESLQPKVAPTPIPKPTPTLTPAPAPANPTKANTMVTVIVPPNGTEWMYGLQAKRNDGTPISVTEQKINAANDITNPKTQVRANGPLKVPADAVPEAKAAPSPMPAAAPSPANTVSGTTQITLKANETWWWLAQQGARVSGANVITELHKIEADNPGESASKLPIDSKQTVPIEVAEALQPKPETPVVAVPAPALTPAPKSAPTATVIVRPGDTMSGLAEKAGNSGFVGQIKADNPGVNPEDMQPGQALVVPPKVAQADQAPAASALKTEPAPSPASEAHAATAEAPAGTPYLEDFFIKSLGLLAQRLGMPEEALVTYQHLLGLVAWAWVEQGAIANSDSENPLNEGVQGPGLATRFNASGLEGFINEQYGVEAFVATIMGSNQNRVYEVLANPNSTAVQIMQAITWWEKTSGDRPWAEADDPAAGYSQQVYEDGLLNTLNRVSKNYPYYATVQTAGSYTKNKPHVSEAQTYFDQDGNVRQAANPAPPTPAPTATVPTTATTEPAPTTSPTSTTGPNSPPSTTEAPTTTTTLGTQTATTSSATTTDSTTTTTSAN